MSTPCKLSCTVSSKHINIWVESGQENYSFPNVYAPLGQQNLDVSMGTQNEIPVSKAALQPGVAM